jgi:hypothetical protein
VAIEVGEIVATLKGDTKQFSQAMSKSNAEIVALGGASVALGNIATQAFSMLAAGVVNASSVLHRWTAEVAASAERTHNLSMQLGVSERTLEGWGLAATHAGLNIDGLAGGMRTLSRHMEGLASGSEESVEAFEKLGTGLTAAEAAGLDTEQVIKLVADRFKDMPDGAEKSALAIQLFGRAGLQLLPILNQGSEGLDKASQKAKEFGLELSGSQRIALDNYDQALDDLSSSLEGFKTQVAAAFAPSLTKTIEFMTSAVSYAKSIFVEFSIAAEKLFIRFGAIAAVIELVGKQIFSLNALNKESWDLTIKQIAAIDEWAGKEIKAAEAVKNTGVQMEKTAKSAKKYTVSQKTLGEQIVKFTQIQVKQQQDIKEKAMQDMAGDLEKGARTQDFVNQQIDDNMTLYYAQKETDEKLLNDQIAANMDLYYANKANSQKLHDEELSATMDLYYANKEAAEKQAQDQIAATMEVYYANKKIRLDEEAAEGRAQEELGKFIVKKEQERQAMQFGWKDVFGEMSQSAQFAFGQIRANFGQTVANLVQGTASWADFWKSTQSSLINSAVQFGIDIVGKFIAKNALILATETATALGVTSIWTATSAAVLGAFGAMAGGIALFFTGTIVPMFAAIGTAVMTFLGSIATALDISIFGAPFSIPVWVAVGLIAAAVGTISAFAFGAFAEGGLVKGPMMGLVGEAGPELIVPLDRLGELGGSKQQTIIIEMDGRTVSKSVFDNMAAITRLRMGRV